jgi:hypothetical protein
LKKLFHQKQEADSKTEPGVELSASGIFFTQSAEPAENLIALKPVKLYRFYSVFQLLSGNIIRRRRARCAGIF